MKMNKKVHLNKFIISKNKLVYNKKKDKIKIYIFK